MKDADIEPSGDQKPMSNSLILHEVDENTSDIEGEIRKILELSKQSKLELLIDGGVFA